MLDKAAYEQRQRALQDERLALQRRIEQLDHPDLAFSERVTELFELLKALQRLKKETNGSEMRGVFKSSISNCTVHRKILTVQWEKPFQVLRERSGVLSS